MPDQVTFPRRGADYVPLPRGKEDGKLLAHAVQTIRATPEEVFNVYSRAELLPTWQEGVVSVTSEGENRLHWVMQDPGTGKQVEFSSEIVEATPGVKHVSRVTSGPFEGTTDIVTFQRHPAGRGTIVTMITEFHLPGNVLTNAVSAVVSRSPEQMVIENLRHLKELMESGEVPSVEGQPAGPRGVIGKWKQFLLGENLPTPPGSSDRARPEDMPQEHGDYNALKLTGVALVAGAFGWVVFRAVR